MTVRTFESGPARREATLVSVGVIGPSGSGKTKSALRLADGIARVRGGDTWLIDSNNRRSLHHAAEHRFHVLHLPPPHSPADYGHALAHAVAQGARRIIVDDLSQEWEGDGGVLDMHEAELDRMTRGNVADRDRYNMAAWIAPKREHNRLKLWMFSQPVDWILTFRAKDKIKPVTGGKPKDLGSQPIGADDVVYELLLRCLLPAQADGKPTWSSDVIDERKLIKLPGWFRDLFSNNPVLSEDVGEQLARWATGADISTLTATSSPRTSSSTATGASSSSSSSPDTRAGGGVGLVARFDACTTREAFDAVDAEVRRVWRSLAPADLEAVKRAGARAERRLAAPPPAIGAPADDEAREIVAAEAAEHARQQQEQGGQSDG